MVRLVAAAHLRVLRDQLLPGDRHAVSRRVENEAVIPALDAGLDEAPEMQRCSAMTAAVGKRRRSARAVAKKHDRIAADAARERLVVEFVGPGTDIPGISQQHSRLPGISRGQSNA